MPTRLLSYNSVADLLDCSTKTIKRLVENGLLAPPSVYNGVGQRFREEDVLLYLATSRKPVSREKPTGQERTGRDK